MPYNNGDLNDSDQASHERPDARKQNVSPNPPVTFARLSDNQGALGGPTPKADNLASAQYRRNSPEALDNARWEMEDV